MIVAKCGVCGVEIVSNNKSQCCGCSNMTTVTEDKVTARDLRQGVMVTSPSQSKSKEVLSPQELAWQEERRKRKVRKLDFEIR